MRDCGCHSQLSQGPQRREVILNQCEAVGGTLTAWTNPYSIMTATCSTSQSYFHELVVPPLSHASDLTQLLNFSGSAAVVRPLEHNGRQRLFCKSQCNDRWRSFTVGVTSSQLTELMRLNEKNAVSRDDVERVRREGWTRVHGPHDEILGIFANAVSDLEFATAGPTSFSGWRRTSTLSLRVDAVRTAGAEGASTGYPFQPVSSPNSVIQCQRSASSEYSFGSTSVGVPRMFRSAPVCAVTCGNRERR